MEFTADDVGQHDRFLDDIEDLSLAVCSCYEEHVASEDNVHGVSVSVEIYQLQISGVDEMSGGGGEMEGLER